MIRIYLFIVFSLTLVTLPILAQEPKQSAFLELDLTSDLSNVKVIALPDSSLLLYNKTINTWYTKATFEFTKYDHQLKKIWSTTQEMDVRSEYIYHFAESPYVYIALDKIDKQKYFFVRIDLSSGKSTLTEYEIPAINAIEEFKVLNGQYFVIGTDKKHYRPSLLHINPDTKTISPLPSVYGNDSFFSDLLADPKQNRVDVVLLESNGRVSHLQTKSFSPSGKLLGTYFTPPQRGKLLQKTQVSPGDTLQKLLIGTYGSDNINFSSGFYTMPLIQQNNDVNYYSFIDLKNALSHLKKRQENRIRKREEERLQKRKETRLKHRLLLHDLIATPTAYIQVAEVYTTQYNSNSDDRTSFGLPFRQREGLYKHKQVLVVAFNKRGELIWDNSFKLDDITETDLVPTVEVGAAKDSRVIIVYPDKEKITYHIMDKSNFSNEKTKLKLKAPHEGDKITGTSENGVINWYGSNFAAFGFHRVRSANREARNVFYINKITF
jgi:hypothetical protein